MTFLTYQETNIIKAAFTAYLESDPQYAIDDANGAFDEANRAEYERQPVSLW